MYIIAYLIAFVSGLVNPHIGLFSAFNIIVCLIVSVLENSGERRLELARFLRQTGHIEDGDGFYRNGKRQFTVAVFVSLVCFVLYVAIGTAAHIVSVRNFGGEAVYLPEDFLMIGHNNTACGLLLGTTLCAHILASGLLVRRRNLCLHEANSWADITHGGTGKISFRLSVITVVLLLGTVICSGLLAHDILPAILVLAGYSLIWFTLMYGVNGMNRGEEDETGSLIAEYSRSTMLGGGRQNRRYLKVVWATAVILSAVTVIMMLTKAETQTAGAVMRLYLSGLCAVLLEFLTACSFVRDIRRIESAGDK